MRRALILLAVVAVGCGGGARQDADEPSGEFKVEVVDASFPQRQHIADDVQLKITVRNADEETLRNVAVTVETKPRGKDAAVAFGLNERGAGLSDASRPVWVLDEGPKGGDVVNVNTWSAGELNAGESRELTWNVVPARAGTYEVSYRVSPGLTGRGTAARGDTSGSFNVTIDDEPVPARVGDDGKVERGEPRALERGDVDGLRALGPGLGFIGHARALAQRAEAVGVDAGVMDEVVRAGVVGRDEPESLVVVEPLHGAGGQGGLPRSSSGRREGTMISAVSVRLRARSS